MKTIRLRSGGFTKVDDADFERYGSLTWSQGSRGYVTHFYYTKAGVKCVLLHRLITGAKRGQHVDHKNRDKLDNRRLNLRPCSPSQNLANGDKHKDGSSGFKGVSWDSRRKRWRVQIRDKFIGRFATARLAAMAYDRAAISLFGKFALTNRGLRLL